MRRIIVAAFGILFSIVIVVVSRPTDGQGGFWIINDFHVNLSYNSTDRPFGDRHYDPPLTLFEEAVKFCSQKHAEPDFVLLLGDFVAHIHEDTKNGSDVLLKTMKETVRTFRKSFPLAKTYPVLGNHDQFPTRAIFNNSYYEDLLEKGNWNELFNDRELSEQFRKGGYYSVDISDSLRLIVLNSIVLMSDFRGEHNEIQMEQIEWMTSQLKDAEKKNMRVFLVSHVPIGMGNNFDGDPNIFLHDKYNERLLLILSKMQKLTIINFWGHQHTDQFKFTNELVALISPAISPYHQGSNPSVRYCTYDHSGLVDYEQFTMDLNMANKGEIKWNNTYTLRRAYNTNMLLTRPEMIRLAKRIVTDPLLSQAYLSRVFAFIRQVTMPRKFLCMINSIRESEFIECLGQHRHVSFTDDHVHGRFLVAATSICCVIFALMAMLFLNVCKRRNALGKKIDGESASK